MPGHDIIAIGASNGGVEALCTIAAQLPADLPAAVLVVVHVDAGGPRVLSHFFKRIGPLPAAFAQEGEPVRGGRIYIAPPDLHLRVDADALHLARSPRENRARPAIDPLFRSVAHAYGRRAVGVVLTGSLDDGAAGLGTIKARGGITVVQDPADALFPEMPQAALRCVPIDHCVPLRDIPGLLVRLAGEEAGEPSPGDPSTNGAGEAPVPSALSCPTCHGVLWEREEGKSVVMECRIGHVFGVESLLAAQADDLETALWGAVRALEESAAVERRLATRLPGEMGRRHGESARAKKDQAQLVRRMLLGSLVEAVVQDEDVTRGCGRQAARPH